VIFWKQVGHSITVPLCDESHFMCWPHTGHAYLNSLMARGNLYFACINVPFSKPDRNPAFSFVMPGGTGLQRIALYFCLGVLGCKLRHDLPFSA
jgi:hypothetical protein